MWCSYFSLAAVLSIIPILASAQPYAVDYNDYLHVEASIAIDGEPRDLVVRDGLAYVSCDDYKFQIWDVSAPTAAVLVGHHDSEFHLLKFILRENVAYVSTFYQGIVAIDISDPSSIVELSRVEVDGNDEIMAIIDEIALVNSGFYGVHLVDISDPSNMGVVGNWNPPGNSLRSIAVHGHAAYATGSFAGLMFFDEVYDLG